MRIVLDTNLSGKDWLFRKDPANPGEVIALVSKQTEEDVKSGNAQYFFDAHDRFIANIGSSGRLKNRNFEQIRELHEAFKIPIADEIIELDKLDDEVIDALNKIWNEIECYNYLFYKFAEKTGNVRYLRIAMLMEEFKEYIEAESEPHAYNKMADSLGDMGVIIDGTALCYGIDLPEIRDAIHISNMSKLGEDGEPILDPSGKIAKGPKYEEPDLTPILFPHTKNEIENDENKNSDIS